MTSRPRLLTLFLLSGLAGPALSQEAVRPAGGAQAEAARAGGARADDARERRRVLELAGGDKVRVLSRWNADRWEYQSKGAWKALAPGQVIAVTLEKDLLREWEAKRSSVAKPDPDARAALAAWAQERGLVAEGLAELDRVLDASPDHAGALRLLAEREWLRVPAAGARSAGVAEPSPERDAFYRFASALPPAAREVAVRALGDDPDRAALGAELARELGSSSAARRSFAALALRRLCAGSEVQPLLRRAVLDPSPEVRRDAGLALRAAEDPALVLPVVRALESRSGLVRVHAAEALAHMSYAAAVEPLVAYLAATAQLSSNAQRAPRSSLFIGRQVAYIQDFDVEVAQGQAIADPQVNVVLEGSVLDVAVRGMQEVSFGAETGAAKRALASLTGADPGSSNKAWLAWWQENGAKWRSADHAAPPPVTAGGPR